MEPYTKNTNTRKRKHFQLNPSSVFSTWHLAETDVTSHLMLISQQPAIIPKITRYPSKKSYHFQPNPFNKCWMSSPAVWNHPSDLIGFCPKQTAVLWQLWQLRQLFHDSCHSFSWQLGQPFQNNCDSWPSSLSITVFFHIWLKPKLTIVTTFFLAKILSFSAILPPTTLTRNSKNTLKLNIPFLAKS